MQTFRLNVFIAKSTGLSRRKADEVIFASRVKVNGQVETSPATQVSELDEVQLDRKVIKPETEMHYLLLHKPKGYTSTLADKHAEHVISELMPPEFKNLKPAGRLDVETTGAIVMTNDGDFIFALTHPRCKVEKQYRVQALKMITEEQLNKLERGVMIEGRKTAPAKAEQIDDKSFYLTIAEGRKRQVRKMCDAVRNPVAELQRVRIAGIELGNLKRGKYRELTKAEINSIYNKPC